MAPMPWSRKVARFRSEPPLTSARAIPNSTGRTSNIRTPHFLENYLRNAQIPRSRVAPPLGVTPHGFRLLGRLLPIFRPSSPLSRVRSRGKPAGKLRGSRLVPLSVGARAQHHAE